MINQPKPMPRHNIDLNLLEASRKVYDVAEKLMTDFNRKWIG